jgi:hypothetical protein
LVYLFNKEIVVNSGSTISFSFYTAVQHERAPRSISKGKGSFTVARKSLEGRRERRKKSISKVKYEKEQLSSEPNSPYSSPISPEQWNELESSADIVFSNFDSHSKKDEDEPNLSCNDTINGDSKLISDVLGVTSEKRNMEQLDKSNKNMQYLEHETGKNSENFQISNSSTEGESSTNYDENNSKNSNENQNEVIETNMNNINDHDNSSEVKRMSIQANHSYNTSAVTNFGFCSEQSVQSELCPPTSFSLYDSSIQLLYMSVSWARSIPMFMDLPFRDQAILLEEAWSELFLLNAVHYFLPVDLTTLISATGLSPSQSSTSKLVKEIRTLQNVVARFHQLQINAVEYACLKAVVLFKSGMFVITVRIGKTFLVCITVLHNPTLYQTVTLCISLNYVVPCNIP